MNDATHLSLIPVCRSHMHKYRPLEESRKRSPPKTNMMQKMPSIRLGSRNEKHASTHIQPLTSQAPLPRDMSAHLLSHSHNTISHATNALDTQRTKLQTLQSQLEEHRVHVRSRQPAGKPGVFFFVKGKVPIGMRSVLAEGSALAEGSGDLAGVGRLDDGDAVLRAGELIGSEEWVVVVVEVRRRSPAAGAAGAPTVLQEAYRRTGLHGSVR
jgi:hypothetical protein